MVSLTLSEALASNRLEEFVSQAEAQGIGPASTDMARFLLGMIDGAGP